MQIMNPCKQCLVKAACRDICDNKKDYKLLWSPNVLVDIGFLVVCVMFITYVVLVLIHK